MAPHPAATPESRPYEYKPYPSVRYRRNAQGDLESCVVNSADDDQQLGPEWVDSPAQATATAPAAAKTGGNGDKKKKADEPELTPTPTAGQK